MVSHASVLKASEAIYIYRSIRFLLVQMAISMRPDEIIDKTKRAVRMRATLFMRGALNVAQTRIALFSLWPCLKNGYGRSVPDPLCSWRAQPGF